MKILAIILGALVAVAGVYCMMQPVATFLSLGWLVGLAMIFEGVSAICRWNVRRSLGFRNSWTLVGGIVSILLGAYVTYSGAAQVAIDTIIAYLAAIWLVFSGITRVRTAFALKDIHATGTELGRNWGLVLVAGILVIVAGFFCCANPVVAMAGIGFIIGMSVAVSGISAVMAALSI